MIKYLYSLGSETIIEVVCITSSDSHVQKRKGLFSHSELIKKLCKISDWLKSKPSKIATFLEMLNR